MKLPSYALSSKVLGYDYVKVECKEKDLRNHFPRSAHAAPPSAELEVELDTHKERRIQASIAIKSEEALPLVNHWTLLWSYTYHFNPHFHFAFGFAIDYFTVDCIEPIRNRIALLEVARPSLKPYEP